MRAELFDVIILGAGASGLMAGATAGARGRSALILDHAVKPARKIRIAGGGKANFTNLNMGPEYYVGNNPQFCRSALQRFSPEDSINWVSGGGIRFEEREQGQIFCRSSANDLANLLLDDCRNAGCTLLMSEKVSGVRGNGPFDVHVGNRVFRSRSLVIATGGPAWPKIGATSYGLTLARQFGHETLNFRPALAGLVMPVKWPLAGLEGISLKVDIRLPDHKRPVAENLSLVFTHTGVSGPAALQASLHWKEGSPVILNFLPGESLAALLEVNGKLLIKNLVRRYLPDRLADALTPSRLADVKSAELGRKDRELLYEAVHAFQVLPGGTEGYARAEAARGGVDTGRISSKTMQSRLVPGLYFCGEVLDVTGRLGGYNLHWAFASGRAVGLSL